MQLPLPFCRYAYRKGFFRHQKVVASLRDRRRPGLGAMMSGKVQSGMYDDAIHRSYIARPLRHIGTDRRLFKGFRHLLRHKL